MTRSDAVSEVVALFEQHGGSSYAENVTLAEHCRQTAALAMADGASDVLVAAALLHDVGHLLLAADRGNEDFLRPDWAHDRAAADWLRPRFGDRIADVAGAHVDAKRWLCATEPGYSARLSPASTATLVVQGGPFDEAGVASFDELTFGADAVRVRRWDDAGKVPGLHVPELATFVPVLEELTA